MKSLNTKFTDLADRISEQAGTWPIFGISILLVISWLIAGPAMHYSDTWQLMVNTPTTVVELWLGLLTLASTNRVQRKQEHMMKEIDQLIRSMKKDEEQILKDVEGNK